MDWCGVMLPCVDRLYRFYYRKISFHWKQLGNNMSGATANDFKKWRDLASIVTIDSLEYIIKDCREARDAMKGHNPERENYYADMGFTYADELYRRTKVSTGNNGVLS